MAPPDEPRPARDPLTIALAAFFVFLILVVAVLLFVPLFR